jgi:hypothetical protein
MFRIADRKKQSEEQAALFAVPMHTIVSILDYLINSILFECFIVASSTPKLNAP